MSGTRKERRPNRLSEFNSEVTLVGGVGLEKRTRERAAGNRETKRGEEGNEENDKHVCAEKLTRNE